MRTAEPEQCEENVPMFEETFNKMIRSFLSQPTTKTFSFLLVHFRVSFDLKVSVFLAMKSVRFFVEQVNGLLLYFFFSFFYQQQIQLVTNVSTHFIT